MPLHIWDRAVGCLADVIRPNRGKQAGNQQGQGMVKPQLASDLRRRTHQATGGGGNTGLHALRQAGPKGHQGCHLPRGRLQERKGTLDAGLQGGCIHEHEVCRPHHGRPLYGHDQGVRVQGFQIVGPLPAK